MHCEGFSQRDKVMVNFQPILQTTHRPGRIVAQSRFYIGNESFDGLVPQRIEKIDCHHLIEPAPKARDGPLEFITFSRLRLEPYRAPRTSSLDSVIAPHSPRCVLP